MSSSKLVFEQKHLNINGCLFNQMVINLTSNKMDTIFKNNGFRILELFIEHPNKDYFARGIARELKITHATVLKYLKKILELGFVKKKKETLYPTYYANTENEKYKSYKKNNMLFKIKESGLVNHIQKQTLTSSIILFGSSAKATYNENSDIDIFVEAKQTKLNVSIYEKILKRKINLLFEAKMSNLSKELKNNIVNGIILYGFIRL